MQRTFQVVFVTALTALCTIETTACDGAANSLNGGANRQTGPDGGEDGTPAALQCTDAPVGRSYPQFDGSKLEDSRVNENVGVNRARVKPFAALEKEFQRVLGVVPTSLKGAAGSFDVPAPRWFGEPEYSGVSLHAMANISFDGCLAYTKTNRALAAAPTADSAKTECATLMRKAWSRSPSPEEIGACADLATKLGDEKDVHRRWAYVCTSVLSASQFLTF